MATNRPTREEWNALRARLKDELSRHGAALRTFGARVGSLFGEMLTNAAKDGEPLRRKPNISLRLLAAGEPLAKLIVLPHWVAPRGDAGGRLECDRLSCELWLERRPADHAAAVRLQKRFTA